jgi:hypothetical protein
MVTQLTNYPVLIAAFAAAQAILTETAVGQPIAGNSASVEWLAAQSPLIVRAVIEDIAEHDPNDAFNCYQTISVRVLETVKGQHSPRLQFVHNFDFGPVRLSELKNSRQEVLLFLDHWMRVGRFSRAGRGYAYARFPYAVRQAAILTPRDVQIAGSSLPLHTARLRKLSTPDELIGAIKDYLRERGDQPAARGVTMELPQHLRGSFVRVDFTFPTDAYPDHPQAAVEKPVSDFAALRERFAKPLPKERKPPYARNRGGYIGVSALELMAADCDAIVRGVVEDWFFVSTTSDPTGPACGMRLRVLETFKGEVLSPVNVFLTDARDLESLQRDGRELLLFLRNQRLAGTAAAFGYQTREVLWDDSAIVLHRREAEVLFADLTWQRQPDEILRRLRTVASREVKRARGAEAAPYRVGYQTPPVFDFHPPESIAGGSSISGNEYSVVYLPVDSELETKARAWAASENKDLRWLAARALIYFPTDRNAALLRTLLDDRATWSRREMLPLIRPNYPEDEPELLVRWEAWNVLNGWGRAAPRPNFR